METELQPVTARHLLNRDPGEGGISPLSLRARVLSGPLSSLQKTVPGIFSSALSEFYQSLSIISVNNTNMLCNKNSNTKTVEKCPC